MTNSFLKGLRVMRGLTQQDMAEVLNVSTKTYCKKELGQSDFSLTESKKIADLFEKPIEEIFFNKKCNTKRTNINTA